MDEQDNSTFRIPVSNLVLEAQNAAVEEMPVTPATPIVIEQAFPYRSKEKQELDLYNELSAVSDEVIACRNSILSNIY